MSTLPLPPSLLSCPRPRAASAPVALALSARETARAAFHVLADPWLFQHISSFQGGIPVALRQFWLYHDPQPSSGPIDGDDITQLIKLVVESGSLRHLELLKSSRCYENDEWRAPRLRKLARTATGNHRPDIIEWMLANNMALSKPNNLWREAIQSARSKDEFSVLELLERICPLTESSALRLIPDMLFKPTVALLQWITSRYPTVVFPAAAPAQAAAERDLPVLDFLLNHPRTSDVGIAAFRKAYRAEHHDVLELLIAKCIRSFTCSFARELLVDSTPRIQEIVSRHPTAFTSARREVFLEKVRAGDSDGMTELYTAGSLDMTEPISIDEAASWTGLTGLEFLHTRGIAQATTEAMDFAAEKNRWDVVEFLHINRTEGCTTRAADAAVKSEDMGCVRFFLENRSEGCSTSAMDEVATHGSMEMLRYLHDHSKAGCTSMAMDWAATRGRLRVVQFLHKYRSEGCTTAAIDNAASGGHFKVVKFLCENRTEGCTLAGIRGSLEKHHLEVVQVLYKHYPQHFGAELLSVLLLHGAFEIFMKLRDEFPEEAGSVVESVMFDAGKQFELRTIRFILSELGRSDLVGLALEGAASINSGVSARWEEALEAITSPSDVEMDTAGSSRRLLHPLVRDARAPTWAVRRIFDKWYIDVDVIRQGPAPSTWAVLAIYHQDLELLKTIRDLPPDTTEPRDVVHFLSHPIIDPFSFEGARAVAIRLGDQDIVEWLLTNVDLPIEPTLLGEALYYHQFELAELLLEKYPAACTDLDWTQKGIEARPDECGLQQDLFDWLESHDAVHKALPFVGIIDFAARKNDVVSLERLHQWYPELFTPRRALVELADREECSGTINFLLEIGWDADIFMEEW